MNLMRELYTQVIMDHYQRPRNRGELENARLEAHLLNPLCGDEITVYAIFNDDRVADVKFSGQGCSISQASASMMTERLMGKSCEAAKAEIAHFKSMMVGEFPRGRPGRTQGRHPVSLPHQVRHSSLDSLPAGA